MEDRPRMPARRPPRMVPAVRLKALRELTLAFLQELDSITASETPASEPGVDFYEEVRRFEADLIRRALMRAGGHQRRAARMLNLKAATLNSLIKRYDIRPDAFKTATGVIKAKRRAPQRPAPLVD